MKDALKLAFTVVMLGSLGLLMAVGIWATDWVAELQALAAFLASLLFLSALPFVFIFAFAGLVGLICYLLVGRKP